MLVEYNSYNLIETQHENGFCISLPFGVNEMKMKLGSIKENPFPINTITKTDIVQFQLLDSKWWRTKSTIKWFHFSPCRDIPNNFQTISETFFFFLLRTKANLWYHYFELVLFQLLFIGTTWLTRIFVSSLSDI